MSDGVNKICRQCGQEKPRADFYADARSADRLRYECKACSKSNATERQKTNPETARAIQAAYRNRHRDAIRARNIRRRRRPEIKAKIAAYTKAKYAANPEASKAHTRRYRAQYRDRLNAAIRERYRTDGNYRRRCLAYNAARRRFHGQGSLTMPEWAEVWASYGGLCVYCGDPAISMDHVTPFKAGGRHEKDNVVPACKPCNCRKQALPLLVFVARGGLRMAA